MQPRQSSLKTSNILSFHQGFYVPSDALVGKIQLCSAPVFRPPNLRESLEWAAEMGEII